MDRADFTRDQRRALERENAKLPTYLVPVEGWQHRSKPEHLVEVWRSRSFLVQVFREQAGIVRASINRTSVNRANGCWLDGITWDELQVVKREIGRGHLDAVEVYPSDRDIVNVANMRHLFIFDDPLAYVWRKAAYPVMR